MSHETTKNRDSETQTTPASEQRITALSELGQAAGRYAMRGWHVLPCDPRDKRPHAELVPNGFKNATNDLSIVCSWWEKHPDANIGIRTGRESGIWVLDIDGNKGGNESIVALQEEYEEIAVPLMARTGSGLHLYYTYAPERPVSCRTAVRPGIDVRGDGGYVVAPPSIHPNGSRYEWLT
jgi:hypothetical protein